MITGNYRGNLYYDFPNVVTTRGDVNNFVIKNNIFGTNSTRSLDFPTSFNIYHNTTANDHDLDMLIDSNVIYNSTFTGILIANCKGVIITNNDIQRSQRTGIALYYTEENTQAQTFPNSSPGNGPLDNEVMINSNTIANNGGVGIDLNGSSPIIKGNLIENNGQFGIFSYPPTHQTIVSRLDALDPINAYGHYLYSRPIIGGSNLLTGSLCNGIEANCIRNNNWGGIASLDTVPWNENTLQSANVFSANNDRMIEQSWTGIYEIFSNNIRRTDLAEQTITLKLRESMKVDHDPSVFLSEIKNYRVNCLESVDCSDQGIAYSSGRTATFGPIDGLVNLWDRPEIVDYYVDDSGVRHNSAEQHFDQDHVASGTFSFDGDSTSDPVNTGSLRVKTFAGISQNFYDRGEPWTDTAAADRDEQDVTLNGLGWYEYHFGGFQIMEVELVDANPVLQGDGTYVITVDSTTDEDNVSSSGYDDGGGAYSGGGNNGPDGLPNGKTSLKEAIIVANNHAGVDYIYFDIPENDPSHVCYQDDGVAGQVTSGNAVATTVKDDPSCGGTQIDSDYPYSWFALSSTGTYTIFGPTIIDGYTQDGAQKNAVVMGNVLNHVIKIDTGSTTFNLNGGNSVITGIVMSDGSCDIILNSSNNWINGIYMGVDASGTIASGTNHLIDVNSSGNIIGSNLDGNNDNAEINVLNHSFDCVYPGTSTATFINLYDPSVSYTKVNRNHINTGRTGKETGSTFRSAYAINLNNSTYGTPIAGVQIHENIIANNHLGLGSRASNIHSSIEMDVQKNRFNTSWDAQTTLNNHCSPSEFQMISFAIHHGMGGDAGYAGIVADNIMKNYNFYKNTYLGKEVLHPQGYLPIEEGFTYSNNVSEAGMLIYGHSFGGGNRARNVTISNNIITNPSDTGITLQFAQDSSIENNWIGGCLDESSPFFGGYSIALWDTRNTKVIKNKLNSAEDGNSIGTSNCKAEIVISQDSTNIQMSENIIYPSTISQTAIDLSAEVIMGDGRTEDDPDDTDTGGNGLQNYPEITKVEYLGSSQYRISGDLDGNSSESSFDIEICESPVNSSNIGGCIRTLGFTTTSSPWSTIIEIPGDDGTQTHSFSALATNSNGSTSEFSDTYNVIEIVNYEIGLVYPINGIEIDDRTPQLDWNPAVEAGTGYLDPDIHHYEIYIDGSYYAVTDDAITQYQITSPLALGTHTWQIVAFRQLGNGSFVETARSNVENFVIVEANYTFEPIYPVDVTIDDTTPLFDWTDLDPSADFDEYDLYVDGELIAQGLTESEFQLAQSSQLTADSHTWYVIAIRIEPDGSRTEVGRTETAEFTIYIPEVKPPDTSDGRETVPPPPEKEQNRIELLMIDPIVITVPLVLYLLLMGAASGIGSTSLGDFLLKLGVLFGVVVKRKKKYWGVVFDVKESKPIPFAVVRLLREDNSLIKQTVTDLEGRYGLVIDEKGLFTLDVAASGYNSYQKKINVPALKAAFIGQEVVEDVPLLKTGQQLNPLKKLYFYSKPQLLKGFRVFTVVLMFLGFLWSGYATWKSPHIINFIILGIYAILFGLNLHEVYKFRRRNAGRVIDESTGEGIGGVGVRIYEEGKQLEMVLSSSDGYLKFNFKPGVYDFYANKDGYVMATKNNQPLQRIQLDAKGMLEEDIKMKQTSSNV